MIRGLRKALWLGFVSLSGFQMFRMSMLTLDSLLTVSSFDNDSQGLVNMTVVDGYHSLYVRPEPESTTLKSINRVEPEQPQINNLKDEAHLQSKKHSNVSDWFPSMKERLDVYLGSWRFPCQGSKRWRYYRSSNRTGVTIILSSEDTEYHLEDIPNTKAIFELNLFTVRGQQVSPDLSLVSKVWADSVLPSVDLQHFKYDPSAVPVLVQPDHSEQSLNLPRLSGVRDFSLSVSSETEDICRTGRGSQPFLWDTVGPIIKRAVKQIHEREWREKKNRHKIVGICHSCLGRGSPVGGDVPFMETEGEYFSSVDQLLENKMIVLAKDDPVELAWALWSNSVVLRSSSVTSTSWLMEDLLQPWVHYVPLDENLTNINDQIQWVRNHDREAMLISQRATQWINRVWLGKSSQTRNQKVMDAVIRRYSAQFILDRQADESPTTISYHENIADILITEGGRNENELLTKALDLFNRGNRSERTPEKKSAAMCYKNVFGATDLHRFIKWATYNYLLGFDMTFIWYLPNVRRYKDFKLLDSLPYVTLIEDGNSTVKELHENYELTVDGNFKEYQLHLERECLENRAKAFDWVMFADADEYLWFRDLVGLKDFLAKHTHGLHYLSFGKVIYDRDYGVRAADSGFGLDSFPFASGVFCAHGRNKTLQFPGSKICPMHAGRAKVMVKPSKYTGSNVRIHGTHIPDRSQGSVHFHPDIAHMKEWPKIFLPVDMQVKPPRDFTVKKSEFHNLTVHKGGTLPNPNGTYSLRYDQELHDWFEFVAQRSNK